MTESELIRLVKTVIKKELANILLGQITDTSNAYVTSQQRFVTDAEIDGLRLIRPYGFASRPPSSTECVVAPVNADPSHLIILGEFDNGNRPAIDDGESILYGPDGQIVYMESGGDVVIGEYLPEAGGEINPLKERARFGSDGSSFIKNLIGKIKLNADGSIDLNGGTGATHGVGLGDVIENRLTALENALSTLTSVFGTAHTHAVISLGSPTGPPLPPTSPFIAVALPAASLTVKVST